MLWNNKLSIILLYLSISLIKSFTLQNYNWLNDEDKAFYIKIIEDFTKLVQDNSNPELYSNENYTKCTEFQPERNTTNTLYNLINYSGKSFGDPGFENDCILNGNNSFILLSYSLDIDKLFADQEREKQLLHFLNTSNFTTGICLYKKCLPFIGQLLDEEQNSPLFAKLREDYYLKTLKFYSYDNHRDKIKQSTSNEKLSVYIFGIITLIVIAFRFLCSILKVVLFSTFKIHQNDEGTNKKKKKGKKKKHKNSDDSDESKEKKAEQSIFLFNESTEVPAQSMVMERTKSQRFVNFFDYSYNLKYLSYFKNKYYTDEGIEILSLFRFVTMIFLTLNHCMYISYMMPGSDYLNEDFYVSWLFFFVKLPTFSSTAWIILDTAITSYKLMTFIKKEMNSTGKNEVTVLVIFMFFLRAIPKIVITLIIYFFLHIYLQYIQYYLDLGGSMFIYYLNNLQKNRFCSKNPFSIFTPFYIQYHDDDPSFTNCFRFANITFNEFYCFILFLVIIYICFKLKKPVFDYFILLLLFINICLTYFGCGKVTLTDYNMNEIQGHEFTEKRTHLFLNYYMIGIFIGMSYFYFGDMISQNSISQNDYIPFNFCYKIISFIDPLSKWIKLLITFIALVFIILLSGLYTIFRFFDGLDTITIKSNWFLTFCYYYEKEIFSIFFCFILLMAMVYPKDSVFASLAKSNVFVIFNRIGTTFFCSSNALIYLANSLFNIKLKLTYQNLFFTNIGLFIFVVVFSILFTILYEMPFRILIKKFDDAIRKREESQSINSIDDKLYPLADRTSEL